MKKIVTIGGGTGSFNTLRGLKRYPFDITAIVTSFDSGGSSGLLRDEYGILPPGDIRRCLVALFDDKSEPILRELFNYRFDKKGTLNGHSFGNLLLTALTQITGNYQEAIDKAGKILNIKGNVFPISLEKAHLCAELENGEVVEGETNIDIPKHNVRSRIKKIFLKPAAAINKKAEEAILEADIIIIGPGDLYTSLIANLLVEGAAEVLQKSKAKKVYICNLMTKRGETDDFKASVFAGEILRYAGLKKFDYVICNSKKITEPYLSSYASEHKFPVEIDEPQLLHKTKSIIQAEIFSDTEILRHDSDKIAEIIFSIANKKEENRKQKKQKKLLIFDLDDTLFDSTSANDDLTRPMIPFDGVIDFLSGTRHKKILVSRGDPELQNAKIEKLGIRSYFNTIHICPTDEGKHSVFKQILEAHSEKHDPKNIFVIGNRIDAEIRYGKMLGLRTVHLNFGKYKDMPPKDKHEVPDHVIEEFQQISELL